MAITMRLGSWLTLVFLAILTAGCPDDIKLPLANAGPEQSGVIVGAAVQLDGSGSSDPQQLPLTFRWRFVSRPAGSQTTLNDPTLTNPSFVADATGDYVIELTVSNGALGSAPATTKISAGQCGGQPPKIAAVASQPANPNTGDLVQLSGTITDPDNDPLCKLAEAQLLQQRWTFVALPAGSKAQLNDPTTVNPSFVVDVPGDFTLRLTVTDSTGRTASQDLTVTVATCGNALPSIDQLHASSTAPNIDQPVQLTADVSDADNAPPCSANQQLRYHWTLLSLPSGSQAQLNSALATNPTFVPDREGDYIVQLEVADATGKAAVAKRLTVTATACGSARPTVDGVQATPPAPGVGVAVSLTATVSDADNLAPCSASPGSDAGVVGLGQTFTYRWALLGTPAGSRAQLLPQNGVTPSFVADRAGDYLAELVVQDSTGRWSQPFSKKVTVSVCGGAAPVVASVTASPATPAVGQLVGLSASVSDADNDPGCNAQQALAYQWQLIAIPSGSQSTLNSTTVQTPSLVPDTPGTYLAQLIVTDATGVASTPALVTITASQCGAHAPVALISARRCNNNGGFCQGLASAGADISGNVQVDDIVQLSAISSYDPDNSPPCSLNQHLSYNWELFAAPADARATLSDIKQVNPWFSARRAGQYIYHLWVSDGTLTSLMATATFQAN